MRIQGKFHRIGIVALAALATAVCARAGEIHAIVKSRDAARLEQYLQGNPGAVNDVLQQDITPLHMAAALNSGKMVTLLLDAGANVNARAASGATPLHWAAMMNAAAAAKALLDAGADTKLEALDGLNALQLARLKKSTAVVNLLEKAVAPAPEVQAPAITGTFADGVAALKAGRKQDAYEILLSLVKKEPANKNVNFALGLAAYSLQKFSHASMAYERVLAMDPGDDRAKLELGRTYYAAGQLDLARRLFDEVLLRNPPAKVRGQIEQMMKAMGPTGGLRKQWSCRLEVGGFYDDNANVGPEDDLIRISPISSGSLTIDTLEVGLESRPMKTFGASLAASAEGGRELGRPGGWSLGYGGAVFGNMMEDKADDLAVLFGGASFGLRRDGRSSVQHLVSRFEHISRGGDSLVNIYGLTPSAAWISGSGLWQATLSGEAEQRDYSDLNDRDGSCYSAGAVLTRFFGKRSSALSAGAGVFYEDTRSAVYENQGGEISATYEQRLPWGMSAYGRGAYSKAAYREKEVLSPEKRSDSQYRWAVGLAKEFGPRWSVNAGWRRTDNISTFDLYDYERNLFSCGVAYRY